MERHDLLNLKKRYLIWLYKTTKEAWDKIERKFTQLEIDKFILKELNKHKEIDKFIRELEVYIQNKQREGLSLKYSDRQFPTPAGSRRRRKKPAYQFLDLKLKAIERAIIKELGKNALREIKSLYEKEMIERILRSRQHK